MHSNIRQKYAPSNRILNIIRIIIIIERCNNGDIIIVLFSIHFFFFYIKPINCKRFMINFFPYRFDYCQTVLVSIEN